MSNPASPEVSVIIPTRNRRHFLEETIDSLFAQTFQNWELIVVDDASDDDTWEWLSGLQDARVRTIRMTEHGERSKARNTGLSEARAERVLFLDDDDLLPKEALQQHIDATWRHPEIVVSVGGHVEFDGKGGRRNAPIVKRHSVRNIWDDIVFGFGPVSGQMLFRKDVIESVKAWDETYAIAEDHHLNMRVMRLGPAALLPEIVLEYRVHDGQWRPFRTWKLAMKIRKRAIKKVTPEERQRAELIYASRQKFQQAVAHNSRNQPLQALRAFIDIFRSTPELFHSPITRPVLLRELGMCFLGGHALHRFLQKFSPKKQVDYSLLKRVESDGRVYQNEKKN